MQSAKLFKKFLMPCGLCAAVPVIKPASSAEDCSGNCKRLIKPSELPLYTVEEPTTLTESPRESLFPALEEQVRNARLSVKGIVEQYQHMTDSVTSKFDTAVAHTKSTVDYLRDEDNLAPRIGAVAIGGLTGLLFGIKGRKFKKFLYTNIGAGVTGAILFPKETTDVVNWATYYLNVGYNFIYGVKPGAENQQKFELPTLPKLPSNFSEFLETTVDLGSTAVSTLGGLAESVYKAVIETEEEKKLAIIAEKKE